MDGSHFQFLFFFEQNITVVKSLKSIHNAFSGIFPLMHALHNVPMNSKSLAARFCLAAFEFKIICGISHSAGKGVAG